MNLYRHTLRLAVPAMLENLLNSLVFLVDALMVAQLGSVQLAATGIVGVVMWRTISIAGSPQIGLGATIARRWGEGNCEVARRLFSHGQLLGFCIGLCLLVMFPLAPYIFGLMKAEGELLDLSVLYFRCIIFAVPFRLASLNLSAAIRAAGDTRSPMITTLLGNAINVCLNYVLIFGHFGAPRLGIAGAGIATAITMTCEFLILTALGFHGLRIRRVFRTKAIPTTSVDEEIESRPVIFARRRKPTDHQVDELRFDSSGWRPYIRGLTGPVLRIAHPVFWEEVAITTGFLIFFAMIAGFGAKALAAHTAIVRLESFSFLAGWGIAIAGATLVGQALGAGDPGRARRTFEICVLLSFTFMGVMGILYCLYPEWFLSWFVGDEQDDFRSLAHPLMIITAMSQPLIGSSMVLAGGLRGAGQTKAPFVAQLIGVLAVRAGLGYVIAFPLGLGLEGIYWGMTIDWLVRTTLLGILVWRGNWEKSRV